MKVECGAVKKKNTRAELRRWALLWLLARPRNAMQSAKRGKNQPFLNDVIVKINDPVRSKS